MLDDPVGLSAMSGPALIGIGRVAELDDRRLLVLHRLLLCRLARFLLFGRRDCNRSFVLSQDFRQAVARLLSELFHALELLGAGSGLALLQFSLYLALKLLELGKAQFGEVFGHGEGFLFANGR